MISEIGSNFWEYSLSKSVHPFGFPWDKSEFNHVFFKSGRNAIKALCQILSCEKRVALPAYTCSTVIDPFISEGWQVSFYRIKKDMTVDLDSLMELVFEKKPSAVLVHSFFGLDTLGTDSEWIEGLKRKGIIIIEDMTQSLFSPHRLENADYYVSSLRKFFAIPDGGVLFSSRTLDRLCDISISDSSIADTALKAFNLKAEYFVSGNLEIKQQFREAYQQLNSLISDNSNISDISNVSLSILAGVDVKNMAKHRRENYLRIEERINHVEPVLKCSLGDSVPLYYPVYVEGERKELQEYLASRNIYCPVIWPRPNAVTSLDKNLEYMYENMLCIPIDQRYSSVDMDRIVSSIEEFYTR